MKVLITATGHPQYGKVGRIIDRRGEHYAVKVPTGEGKLWTLTVVKEGGFKPIKRQEAADGT